MPAPSRPSIPEVPELELELEEEAPGAWDNLEKMPEPLKEEEDIFQESTVVSTFSYIDMLNAEANKASEEAPIEGKEEPEASEEESKAPEGKSAPEPEAKAEPNH